METAGAGMSWLPTLPHGHRAHSRAQKPWQDTSLTCAGFVDVHVKPQHGRAQHEGHPRANDRQGEQDSCRGTTAGKGSAWPSIPPHPEFPWALLTPFLAPVFTL